jgi:hypothetical protein
MTEHYRNKYRDAGWDVFPLTGKDPRVKWKNAFKGDWRDSDNIGVALGARSNGLTDFDADWPEACDNAQSIFGQVGTRAFGRPG